MAAKKKSGPLTHLDDALDKIYEAHAGLGGDLNFINTMFSYLRRKTQFFESPKAAKQVAAMAQRHKDRAVRDSQQQAQKRQKVEQQQQQQQQQSTTVTPIPKPSPAMVEEVDDAEELQEAKVIPTEQSLDAEEEGEAPVGNGGTTDKYTWTQTLKEVTVVVPVPKGTRSRDLKVELHQRSLKIQWKRPPAGTDASIVDGELFSQIDVDASTWTIEDDRILGRVMNFYLLKIDRMAWWDGVIKGDPTIDTRKIRPENSKLGDLDPSTRSTVEKMMFDQRAKASGQATSDETKTKPDDGAVPASEMDFSQAKFM